MKTCTFFGHRDTPERIKPTLRQAILDMIEKEGVEQFYVGAQGRFDQMATDILKELADRYPIRFAVVLAYFPDDRRNEAPKSAPTLFPDGQESVHPRYAIDRRNRWMVEQSDHAIVYVCRGFGGAAQFKALAERKGKTVINLKNKE